MSAVVDLLAAIVTAFLELVVHLLALVFSSSYLVGHSKGLKRWFYAALAASGLHLLLGLVLPVMTGLRTYALAAAFSAPAMLASLVVLLFSIASVVAIDLRAEQPAENGKAAFASDDRVPLMLVSYALAIALVFGAVSIMATQSTRTTLRQELCDFAGGKVSQTWKDRGDQALSFAERLTQRELSGKLPCTLPRE
jgi:hypothetical protein